MLYLGSVVPLAMINFVMVQWSAKKGALCRNMPNNGPAWQAWQRAEMKEMNHCSVKSTRSQILRGTDPLYNLGSGSAPAAASLDLRNTNVGAARHSSRDSRTIHSPSLHLGNSSSRVNIFAIIPLQERILGFTIGSQLWIQNLWILDPRKTISGVGAVALRCKGVWRSVRLNKLALAALQNVTKSLGTLRHHTWPGNWIPRKCLNQHRT